MFLLHYIMEIFEYLVIIPFVVAGLIQTLKLIIDIIKYKKFHRRQLFSAGGFPSVHSGISASVTTIAFIETGAKSAIFAVAVVFTFLFVYDAFNVRYEAWRHAHYINSLKFELEWVLHQDGKSYHLKERLGHTPLEVLAWIIVWYGLTFLWYKFFLGW